MTPRQRQLATWWCSLNCFEVPNDPELATWARSVGLPLPEVSEDVLRGKVRSDDGFRYSAFQDRLMAAAGGHGNTLIVWNEQLEADARRAGVVPWPRPAWLQALFDRDADPRNAPDDLLERPLDLEVDQYEKPPDHAGLALDSGGFLFRRRSEDGRLIAVMPQTYGCACLGIGPGDATWFDDVWDFPSAARAIAEAASWNPDADPEPEGWHRHPKTRRYRPNGNPAQEYTKKR